MYDIGRAATYAFIGVMLSILVLIHIQIDMLCVHCSCPCYRQSVLEFIASSFFNDFAHYHCCK